MIGEALKLLRTFYGYTSTQVANNLGISQSYVSEIENEKKTPSFELLEKYAKMFEMKTSTLIMFAESLNKDQKNLNAKQYVARAGMILLKILEKVGKLEDD